MSDAVRGRWMIVGLALAALAGCKAEDLAPGLTVAEDDVPHWETSDEEEDTSSSQGTKSPAVSGASSLEVLSAFFVESFDAFEEAAAALRERDPRYRLQENTWRLSARPGDLHDSYPLASARFEYAHAAGLTGAGQTISVVDSGFLTEHEVFAGADLFVAEDDLAVAYHGTAVAGVIAADSATMIGVAPGVSLSLGTYYTRQSLAAATLDALDRGAVAQNNSWGYNLDVSTASFNMVFGTDRSYLDALRAYSADGVVVFAASNDPTRTTSTLMEALPHLVPELEAGWIAAVNAVPEFDENGIVSAELISAGCLEAATWCIAGDGAWYSASDRSTTDYAFATGSSFVAPQVSGALALLAEAFPDMTPHDLRIRLLASADSSFFEPDGSHELAPGFWKDYSLDFGNGFIDVRAALLPIGETVMPMASGASHSVDQPLVVSGAALGDAVATSLARHDVLVSDALGAGFSMPGDALVAGSAPTPLMDARLTYAALGEDEPQGFLAAVPAARASLALADTELSLNLVLPARQDASDFGIGLERRVSGSRGEVSFGLNLLHDDSGRLGLSDSDGQGGVWAAALDMRATRDLSGRGFLSVYGHLGVTGDPAPGTGLSAESSGFAGLGLDIGQRDTFRSGDRLSFGVALPTVITSGTASLALPMARNAGGFETVAVDLAPENPEMQLSLSYDAPLGNGWSLTTEAVHSMNRGHVGGQSDTGALFGLSVRF